MPPTLEKAWAVQNVAWISFVNTSLGQGATWDSILASPEYAALQRFVLEQFGVSLSFVPRSEVSVANMLHK